MVGGAGSACTSDRGIRHLMRGRRRL